MKIPFQVKPAQIASSVLLVVAMVALGVRVAGVVPHDSNLTFPLSIVTSGCILAALLINWRARRRSNP